MARIRKYIPNRGISEKEIDWENTKLFSLLDSGTVFINLKGREPKGIVEHDQYHSLIEFAREKLLSLKDPDTGANIIKAVIKGREFYKDTSAGDLPDLLVICNDGYSIISGLWKDVLCDTKFGRIHVSGNHNLDGLLIAYGDKIQNRQLDADICDIMPTILYLMQTSIPGDIDGKILTEIIADDFIENNEIKFDIIRGSKDLAEGTLDPDEIEKLENHLKSLGYLS